MNKFYKATIELIKSYKWDSIFFYYLRFVFFIIIIPVIFLNIALYSNYKNSLISKKELAQNQTVSKAANFMGNIFDTVDKFSSMLMVKDDLYILLSKDKYSGKQITYSASSIQEVISNFNLAFDYIHSVYLYSPENDYTFSNVYSSYVDDFYDKGWYEYHKQTGETDFVISSGTKGDQDKPDIISFCYGINIRANEIVLMVINVDLEALEASLYMNILEENEKFALVINNRLLYKNDAHLFSASGGSFAETKNNNLSSETIASTVMDNRGIELFVSYPPNEYKNQFNQIRITIALYLITTIILAVLTALFASFKFYRSIMILFAQLNTSADEDDKIKTQKYNELVYLCDNMLSTINNHKRLEAELVEKMEKLKKSQSVALQTQISPHFLFNTLNLINGYILDICRGDNDASHLITLLSDIIYIILNTKEHIVPVYQEIEYVKKYVQIESIKHANSFDVIWDIDDDTLQLATVKFVLQPIIENAIFHGIKPLTGTRGVIKISAKTEKKLLVFSVSNNGVPFADEKLREVLNMLELDTIQESKHIGISNVNQRIKLLYGNQYGVGIHTDNNETTVRITMLASNPGVL